MHPILLPAVPIAVLTISAAACVLSIHKTWRDSQKLNREIKKLISDLVNDTIKWCSSNFYSESKKTMNGGKFKSFKRIKNKNWVNDFENIQKESNKVDKFFMINNLKDPHNYINNISKVCQNLITNRKILFLKYTGEEFKKKYKKEFDYISKTVKKL